MKGMVDVAAGRMTLVQIANEIMRIVLNKKPRRLVVDIKRTNKGYYTIFWIPTSDFGRTK